MIVAPAAPVLDTFVQKLDTFTLSELCEISSSLFLSFEERGYPADFKVGHAFWQLRSAIGNEVDARYASLEVAR